MPSDLKSDYEPNIKKISLDKETLLQKSEIVPSPKVEIISIHSEDISKFSTQNHLENKGNLAEIQEELENDIQSQASFAKKSPVPSTTSKFEESEGDGLLNWALNLPEEFGDDQS